MTLAPEIRMRFAVAHGIPARGRGALINGARVALTGQAVAPGLFAVMVALGKEATVTRLRAAQTIAAG